MQQDGGEDQQGGCGAGVGTASERKITGRPGKDADKECLFVAQLFEEDRKEEEEDHIRDLREGHFGGERFPLQFGQVDAHHHEVKVEWDADEEHADNEDGKGGFFQHGKSIQTEDLAEADVCARLHRWSVREAEREKAKQDGDRTG